MRVRSFLWLLAMAACANDDDSARSPATTEVATWPLDGFLLYLPQGVAVTMRLPTADDVAADAERHRGLLRMLGRGEDPAALFFGASQPDGLEPAQGPGLAVTATGAWVHYLPARDKSRLHAALGTAPEGIATREEGNWIVLSQGGKGAGDVQGEPLPPGDLGLRVVHHPLLAVLAHPGDSLDVACDLGGGGLEAHGWLRPAPGGETAACLAAAEAGSGDLLDFIPASLGVRVETTLPATFPAAFLTRRLGAHLGMGNADERVLVERFLREALTGVDPGRGLGIGLEFRSGELSFVVLGRRAGGSDSPILTRMRREERTSFGALVFDRRQAPPGVFGWHAWVAEAEPKIEQLPEAALGLVSGLADEETGLNVTYLEWRDWFVAAAGPRADLLARAVRSKLARGATRSTGSFQLLNLRQRALGDYVLGVVVSGSGLAGLPAKDRAALAALFGATAEGSAPEIVAVAGFRVEGELALEARVLY